MKRIFLFVALLVVIGCTSEKFVVVQIADSQLGFMAAEQAKEEGAEYVNDLSYEVGYLKKAVEFINEIKPDAVVFTGDQVHRSGDQEQWNSFKDAISAIDESVVLLHIPGNHDVKIGKNKVDMTPYTQHFAEDRFIFQDKGVKLVGINSNLIKYNDELEEEQTEWIKEALTKDTRREVTVLFSHHPFFLNNIEEEDGYFQIQKAKRPTYFDIFVDKGVNALYAGHLHDCAEGSYEGIPVKTMTAVAYQLGEATPSVRVITVENGTVSDEIKSL